MVDNFFAQMAQTLGADLGQNLLSKTGNFISQISPLFQAAFSIYVLMVIISYYGQSGGVSFVDFIKRTVGWLVIIGLAFSPGLYMKLANIIYGLPDEVAASFTEGYAFNASALDTSMNQLQTLLDKIELIHDKYQIYELAIHLGLLIKVSVGIFICG